MNANPVIIAVAAVMALVFLAFLFLFFFHFRLWIQALLTNTPAGLFDIIGMRLRGCPPQLIVHAMIALHQRGVRVSAHDAQSYYLAAVVRGERPATAAELADLIEAARRTDSPQT